MAAIWSDQNKFQKWLDVELAACHAQVRLGNLPSDDYKIICDKALFSVDRILEIEADIHHDVIAFLTNLAENIGPSSRYVHLGLTSSDVVDTAFCLQIQDAGHLLLEGIDGLMAALKTRAFEHKETLEMGRTHGVHAEPTTFGLKLTVFYAEFQRDRARLVQALDQLRIGKISGAVGNFAHMPPELEALVCEKLGLSPAPVSTQILQRDRHAQFMSALAILAGTMERLATEIRALQKTEFNEVIEPFSSQQKGSSAMPHKRNPIICERISGLARVVRGYALTAMENQNLWHERDISHSAAERVIFPDATIAIDYMMAKMTDVLSGMVVNTDQMLANIDRSCHVFFSQQLLLKLVEKGMLREDAYRLVQRNAIAAFVEQVPFKTKLMADSDLAAVLSETELDALFRFDKYTRHIDTIFNRVYTG
jgi:adenylosuccinate lyase